MFSESSHRAPGLPDAAPLAHLQMKFVAAAVEAFATVLLLRLVLALVLSGASGEQWEFLVEYGWVLVLAIGFVGLVGAREKTPEMA